MPLTKEQLALRQGGIGGSDIPAIVGLDPWRTPLDIYLQKVGLVDPPETNEAMDLGNRLEPVVAEIYAEREGALVAPPASIYRHPEHSIALGNPDRLVWLPGDKPESPSKGLEIKCRSIRNRDRWGDPGTDEVPEEVALQGHWYGMLCGVPFDVAVLLGGQTVQIYRLQRDEELEGQLLEIALKFWRDHVEPRHPPLDGFLTRDALERLWPKALAPLRRATADEIDLGLDLARVRKELKKYQEAEERIAARLCASIGEDAGIESEEFRATWKKTASGGTDWKGLAESLRPSPETIAKWKRPGSRRFLFKSFDEE